MRTTQDSVYVRRGNQRESAIQIVAQNRGIPDEPALTNPATFGGNDVDLLIGMFFAVERGATLRCNVRTQQPNDFFTMIWANAERSLQAKKATLLKLPASSIR